MTDNWFEIIKFPQSFSPRHSRGKATNRWFSTQIDYKFVFPSQQSDCPNGKLTPAKFVDMYKMFFPSGNAEEFCDHVFRTFDMDKNGYIDFKVSVLFMFNDTNGKSKDSNMRTQPSKEGKNVCEWEKFINAKAPGWSWIKKHNEIN